MKKSCSSKGEKTTTRDDKQLTNSALKCLSAGFEKGFIMGINDSGLTISSNIHPEELAHTLLALAKEMLPTVLDEQEIVFVERETEADSPKDKTFNHQNFADSLSVIIAFNEGLLSKENAIEMLLHMPNVDRPLANKILKAASEGFLVTLGKGLDEVH